MEWKVDEGCIIRRLDRIIVNQLLMDDLGHVDLEHLFRSGSDHAPLLLSCVARAK